MFYLCTGFVLKNATMEQQVNPKNAICHMLHNLFLEVSENGGVCFTRK